MDIELIGEKEDIINVIEQMTLCEDFTKDLKNFIISRINKIPNEIENGVKHQYGSNGVRVSVLTKIGLLDNISIRGTKITKSPKKNETSPKPTP